MVEGDILPSGKCGILDVWSASRNRRKKECSVVQTGITERIIATNHPGLKGTPVKCGSKSNKEDPPCLAEKNLPLYILATQNIQNSTRECARFQSSTE